MSEGRLRRREFLQGGVALGLVALPLGLGGAAETGVRRYKRLGRTAMEISDISLGSSRSADPPASGGPGGQSNWNLATKAAVLPGND